MGKLEKIINDDNKNSSLFAWNCYFIGTFLIVLINILLFANGGSNWILPGNNNSIFSIDNAHHWTDIFYFNPVIRAFCSSFAHFNWQHTLLNMLCFFVCGLYLERKTGSIKFILLIFAMALFTSAVTSTNNLSVNWMGFSGVNFGLYAYIIVEYIFSFQKIKKDKFNLIFGAIVLALIYLAMCFDGGTDSFGFRWYPYDLIHNLGHYSGALAGLILGLTVQIAKLNKKHCNR